MMSKAQRPPTEIVESIAEKAAHVRAAVEILNQNIEDFEAYLSKLKGRVETLKYIDHPDSSHPQDPSSLVLKLHREGKAWALSCCECFDPSGEDIGPWALLRDAPLKFKLAAVHRFPDFLVEIEDSQARLAKEVRDVSSEFEKFAATLKIQRKEVQP